MIYYVAHAYGGDPRNITDAKHITHDLQISDLGNAYICPLTNFSFLGYGELGFDTKMALRLDVLSVCDALIVASDLDDGVQMEIDFANLVGMEVIWLD